MRYREILTPLLTETTNIKFNAAFWRWFHGSKVVGQDGNPLVVYHGTREAFDRFDLSLAGAVGDRFADAAFFTSDPLVASGYARAWMANDEFVAAREAEDAALEAFRHAAVDHGLESPEFRAAQQNVERLGQIRFDLGDAIDRFELPSRGANVVPVFLAIKNPVVVNGGGKNYREVHPRAFAAVQPGVHDGVIVRNVVDAATGASSRPADIFVAFRPEQIKSIHNVGAWNPADSRISEEKKG